MGAAVLRVLPAPRRRSVWLVLVAGFLALLSVSDALAAELPRLTGRVVDDAGIVDAATESSLTARLEAFEKKSSDQIVVATIRSLEGEALEPFANRLFRAWELGQAGENNGVLLLVALDDRKMRIEVGYGLEGTLTDLHSKLIIENTMVPAFRAGDYSAGIAAAVDDIVMVLEGNAAELEARARRAHEDGDVTPWPVILFFIVWGTFFFGGFAMAFLPPIFGRKIGPGRYEWLGMTVNYKKSRGSSGGRSSGGWSSGGGGGGFSGGGGSSGGGGASGSW
ncbi:YgcG family protein [Nitratireductor sp. GISD-1A_MAKvit]|uniref:TPM domain-containing protein n=1 Tax=Nitratireductor sp. GISD-1A_MAKvit TaxID=3234198 RepID=UPI003465255C